MSKHTGKEWHVERSLSGHPYLVVADTGQRVLDAYPTGDYQETCANVSLAAAAPKLVDALRVVVFQMQANRPPSECMALALEAAQEALVEAGIVCGNCRLCGLPMDRASNLCSACAMEEL